jgi:2-polyprenyl-6-methoxyphenol hydroxylase-like FAD-dependent oxidoreductase
VLSPEPNPVRVVLRHADGRLEQAQAPWLISAEGAHSTFRATLDIPFQGKTRDEQYALGDLHFDGELAQTDLHIFSSAHGFLGLFPMGNRRFRLMASNPLSRPTKDTAPALAELQAIYDQRAPIPARFRDMSWSSWFAPFHGSPGPPCQELGAELRIISCVSGADARSVSGAVSLGAPPGGSTGLGSVFGPPVGDP